MRLQKQNAVWILMLLSVLVYAVADGGQITDRHSSHRTHTLEVCVHWSFVKKIQSGALWLGET